MSFADRSKKAADHEAAVMAALKQAGWTAGPWGQALISAAIRERLKGTRSLLRWSPDLVAIRDGIVLLVDAKAGRTDTPNYVLEVDALSAGEAHRSLAPVWYVFSDFNCACATQLAKARDDDLLERRDGIGTSGSGTPFYLIPKTLHCVRTFSSWFDEEAVAA